MGVVGGLAGIYALFRVATWARRDGDRPMSLVTFFKVILYASDALANAFFAVISGFTIWWLIFYKAQYVAVLVPDNSLLYYVHVYVGVAFTLKFISALDLLAQQVTADVFLVDWERPISSRLLPAANQQRGGPKLPGISDAQNRLVGAVLGGGLSRPTLPPIASEQGPEVSMWRRCFVANEWNELQTVRRIRPALLLLLVVLLIDVAGLGVFGYLDPAATADPSVNPVFELSPTSDLLRYPMIVLCFTAVG
jgi:meckelin